MPKTLLELNIYEQNKVLCRWVCLICGMLPVTAIAFHVMGLFYLQNSYPFVILFYGVLAFFSIQSQELRRRILVGWMSGIIAVTLYDLSRIPFMMMGWEDFIPRIGGWLTHTDENFALGYLWRYVGNGGGLGITFFMMLHFMKSRRWILKGALFGLAVCACLDFTLLVSPQSETLMFPISTLTIIGGTVGHLVYGITLGLLAKTYFLKAQSFRL